jgi:hypothetical protein
MSATPGDDLREEMAAGQAVVIVGAGVSMAATGGAPTASWTGLLNDGVTYCEALLGPSLPPGWAERRGAQVASGDLDELVGAAEDLTSRLGGPAGGEFGRWLAASIGKLSPTRPAVLQALAALGVPLATTNYDGLLEATTGRPAVTWRQSALFEQVLRGDYEAILHLHGHWQDPESVVLGIRSYEAVVGNTHAEAMRRALASTRTLVFVGCGSGLDDPNFGALRRWLAAVFASSRYRHYRLCLQQELGHLWREHGLAERIIPIAYGEDHDDLAPFLHTLASGTSTMRSAAVATPRVAQLQENPRRHAAICRRLAAVMVDMMRLLMVRSSGRSYSANLARYDEFIAIATSHLEDLRSNIGDLSKLNDDRLLNEAREIELRFSWLLRMFARAPQSVARVVRQEVTTIREAANLVLAYFDLYAGAREELDQVLAYIASSKQAGDDKGVGPDAFFAVRQSLQGLVLVRYGGPEPGILMDVDLKLAVRYFAIDWWLLRNRGSYLS